MTEDVGFYVAEARRRRGAAGAEPAARSSSSASAPDASPSRPPQAGIPVIGVDSSAGMLEVCRARARAAGRRRPGRPPPRRPARRRRSRSASRSSPARSAPTCTSRDDAERLGRSARHASSSCPAAASSSTSSRPRPRHRGDARALARARAWDLRARRLGRAARGGSRSPSAGEAAEATMTLSWLSPGEWRDLLERAGLRGRGLLRLVRPPPVPGRRRLHLDRPRGSERRVRAVTLGRRHRRRGRRAAAPASSSAMYNRLVRLRNRAENAWAQVDVQLRKRYDLIPNLVETVKGYAAHERETFEEVTQARTAAQQAQGVAQQAQAENMLTAGDRPAVRGRRGLPAAPRDRELPAAAGAAHRGREQIAVSRQVYNDTVLTYDNALETVPTNIIAGMFNFRPREYFQTEDATREAPRVQFEQRNAAPAAPAAPTPPAPPSSGHCAGRCSSSPRVAAVALAAPVRPPSHSPAARRRRRRGRAGRLPARRRDDHRITAPSTARTATSRSQRASRSTGSRVGENGDAVHARRQHRRSAASTRPAPSTSSRARTRVRIVWHFQAAGEAADVHDLLPLPRPGASATTTSSTST